MAQTQIYLFEMFMDQLIFMEDLENTEILANVTGGSLLDFSILLTMNHATTEENKYTGSTTTQKFYKGGKSVFFSATPDNVITALEKNLKVSLSTLDPKKDVGSTDLYWNENFQKDVMELTENIKNIRFISQFNIMLDEKQIAKLDLNMLLLCYGETIEISIANVATSAVTIPILIPKYGNAKAEMKKRSLIAEPWAPLFSTPYKEKRSIIDADLMLYAQMAGVVTDESLENQRLTVDYVNQHLCGHKSCPGAIKFRDWGIGPLAPPGVGLGSIGQVNEAKAYGKYGMSQSYGTMKPYGAYGLLLDPNKQTKMTCGSPTCPFTEMDSANQEKLIGESLDERLLESCCIQNKNKTVKCTCKCCGKPYVKKYPSTCGDPKCPSLPKRRNHVCKGPICHLTGSDHESRIDCGWEECPAFKEHDPTCEGRICPYSAPNIDKCCVTPVCPKESAKRLRGGKEIKNLLQRKKSKRLRGGSDDNFHVARYKTCKCCNKLIKRKTKLTRTRKHGGADPGCENCINADGSYIYEYGAASTRNWRSQSNLPNSCTDPNCSFQHAPDSSLGEENVISEIDDVTLTDSSWGKPSAKPPVKCPALSPDTCIIKKSKRDSSGAHFDYEITREKGTEEKIKRLTRLVSEAGQNLLVSGEKRMTTDAITKSLLNTKHLLSDVVSFEEDDDEIIYLIARLLGQREFSNSMNNFYMDDYFNDSRLTERNDQAIKQIIGEDEASRQGAKPVSYPRTKHMRRGPCHKETCNYMKFKTCSECGGISKSGATCDNSDVSFSYISYSDAAEEITEDNAERQETNRKVINTATDSKVVNKQQINKNKKDERGKHVDIHHKKGKRKSRFIYNCGEDYPGIRLGHKFCRVNERAKNNVPFDMGWLWSVKPDGIKRRRKNWKPGMINTIINERIIAYRKKRGIPDPPELKMILPTKKKDKSSEDTLQEDSDEEIVPKPTLIIQKKEGSYLITMNPLKDPKTLAPHENPYMKCKPMQFIITRPKPLPKKERREHDDGDGEGYSEFDTAYEEDDNCYCNEEPPDPCLSSSSSDSELNIEFTTPAGLIYPEEIQKPPNVIYASTQFKESDFNCQDCPMILPKKFSKRGKSSKRRR